MPVFTDQTGRRIQFDQLPQRIISLVPSQTELLSDLGLEDEVTGITKFCIHPGKWFHSKTRIGGTKQVNIQLVKQLKPDLIIANKEENVKEQVEELARFFPVWISDVNNLENTMEMIEQVGAMTGKKEKAGELVAMIRSRFDQFRAISPSPRTAYLIWQKPYMTVGSDTFIHCMMDKAGFENIFSHTTRYPETSIEEIKAARCELLLLASEPFPFGEKQVKELQPLLPGTKIILVDGEMFSWYGSRLLKAPAYFDNLKKLIAISF